MRLVRFKDQGMSSPYLERRDMLRGDLRENRDMMHYPGGSAVRRPSINDVNRKPWYDESRASSNWLSGKFGSGACVGHERSSRKTNNTAIILSTVVTSRSLPWPLCKRLNSRGVKKTTSSWRNPSWMSRYVSQKIANISRPKYVVYSVI